MIELGIGLIGGMLGGLVGGGGGIIMVPLMVYLLHFSQHRAHATSLAVILGIAITGFLSYLHAEQINWLVAGALAVGSTLGALFGARLMQRLSGGNLRRYFAAFAILVALHMLYQVVVALQHPDPASMLTSSPLPLVWLLPSALLIGLATGVLSGLMGVGGGIIMIPAMTLLLGLGQLIAQGISLAVIIPTALTGAGVHYRRGTLRLADAGWMSAGGIAGSLLGAQIALGLAEAALRIIFSLLLLITGALMLGQRKGTA